MKTPAVQPYYSDEWVTLYQGDCRELVPGLGLTADCIVADPPYGETSLPWDKWPEDWPLIISGAAKSMWCFGSMRMFLDRRDQFTFWRLSQDIIWRKPRGTSFVNDRFVRVHEHALHWYRGAWTDQRHETPRDEVLGAATLRRTFRRASVAGEYAHGGRNGTTWTDNGTRFALSVLDAPIMADSGHPTEKPVAILAPLIAYACPPGGTVLDPFAGSGSTAEAARLTGRKAILVEADERYCEVIARRMAQDILPIGGDL